MHCEVSNGSAKVQEWGCVQEELLWKKEAQTSNFLCEHLQQNGKAKPLCGYQKSDPIVPQATPALTIPSSTNPHPPLSSQLKPQGHCELTSLSRDQKTESYLTHLIPCSVIMQ